MDRREFLKQSAMLSIGGVFLPFGLHSLYKSDSALNKTNFDGKVLVIGAGVSGLYAGYILKSKGIDFQILEASSNYGGRLMKLDGFADYPIDLGAEWLHGKNNILGDLINKTGTKISIDDSEEKYWFNNRIVRTLPREINSIYESEDLPDVSYKDYAIQKGFGREYFNIVESIAGDSGTASSRISAYWKIKEEENWVSGDDDFKFQETYYDLIDKNIAYYVKDNIHLNCAVRSINYSNDTINVTDSSKNIFKADKVIITVPVTILKSGTIDFNPLLPTEKTDAFKKIGMDAGIKVFLKFSIKFFDENLIGGNICSTYINESKSKTGKNNVLLAFVMGEQAEYLTSLNNDNEITSALLMELDVMYNGMATAFFIGSYVQNWTNNPFIRGAYSYSTIGMGNARQIAAQPVNNKLFFAGEAMNTEGHHQTVHGAAETSIREVNNLLKL